MQSYFMKYVVPKESDGSRADRVVKNVCSDVGYGVLQKIFRLGKVKVNGKKVKPDFQVSENDEIFVSLPEKTQEVKISDKSSEAKLREMIIFENKDFIALNKPAGLAVQKGTKVKFCVESLLKCCAEDYRLVHRLDKDTSGILLIAKGVAAARKLTELFRAKKIQKTYWAVVDGKISDSGVIDNYVEKTFVSGEELMAVTDSADGQQAITEYRPIKRVGYYTLLELLPKTGRKHQLRVHCAQVLNAPILGDVKYNWNNQHKHLFLHAKRVEISSLKVSIEAPLPEYWKQIDTELV